jgi:hypothetical protein
MASSVLLVNKYKIILGFIELVIYRLKLWTQIMTMFKYVY